MILFTKMPIKILMSLPNYFSMICLPANEFTLSVNLFLWPTFILFERKIIFLYVSVFYFNFLSDSSSLYSQVAKRHPATLVINFFNNISTHNSLVSPLLTIWLMFSKPRQLHNMSSEILFLYMFVVYNGDDSALLS